MIDHDGLIESIEGDVAHVKITSESACASCHAKGACSAADQADKFIDVRLHGMPFHQGEAVRVQVEKRLGLKAVALGYVYPLLVLMAALILLISLGVGELLAVPLALLSLPVYYLGLYLARNKMNKTFTFSILKTSAQ